VRRATKPWGSAAGSSGCKRGRPRKEPAPNGKKEPSCIWPASGRPTGATYCKQPLVDGLMLCALHAKVLRQRVGKTCLWPGCAQTGLFKPMCGYHTKVAMGLLEPYRS
jgi:hypothetical protein